MSNKDLNKDPTSIKLSNVGFGEEGNPQPRSQGLSSSYDGEKKGAWELGWKNRTFRDQSLISLHSLVNQ